MRILFLLLGVALGVVISHFWPRQVITADYVIMRRESDRLEKAMVSAVSALHTRFAEVILEIRQRARP
jgi:hypothetical protein